jgi:AcrR family transcriptional regulator
MSRKFNILSTAKRMFNAQGYKHVTIRMIAQELNISSGNLNYHFKKREDILDALYFEMVAVFDERVQQFTKNEINLVHIQKDVYLSMLRMVEYSFFWTDLYSLLQKNEQIKTHFIKVYDERVEAYNILFKKLIDKGILQEMTFEKQSQFLIESMINFSNSWLYNSYVNDKKVDKKYINRQSYNLLAILFPYFTTLGKKEFEDIFSEYFD